jgi:catechol 2,3-dioxygenase-like lactoylglutathione lyase family enzyme
VRTTQVARLRRGRRLSRGAFLSGREFEPPGDRYVKGTIIPNHLIVSRYIMSLKVSSLNDLVANVTDVEVSAEWYLRVLGMQRKDLDPAQGKQNRISLLFGNQKIHLRPVSADKEEWVTADHEEAGSEDLCFLTDTTPKEVIDHLKNCGVAIEGGSVNKQGTIGALKSVFCRDPDGSLIEISAYED